MKKLLFVLSCVAFASCFNYRSSLKIDDEGGGSLNVEIGLPLNESLEIEFEEYANKLDSIEGWNTTSVSLDTIDSTAVFRLEGTFSEVLHAATLFEADSLSFYSEKEGNSRKYTFCKIYDPSEDIISFVKDIDYNPDIFHWREEIIGPGRIIKHNADIVLGDTLVWERRTIDVFRNGLTLNVVWEKDN